MAIQPPCSPWPEALDAFVSIEAPFLPGDGSHEVAISQPAKAARSLKKARLLVGGQPRRRNFLVIVRFSDRHQVLAAERRPSCAPLVQGGHLTERSWIELPG